MSMLRSEQMNEARIAIAKACENLSAAEAESVLYHEWRTSRLGVRIDDPDYYKQLPKR